ncbi:MAG: EscU/YscU/HrcU family type III secretion system export apparatus switch protein [Pirellulaceae bacterium]|nr:EscU/YscU/HrcU family type III secretion system export apparatus switch protein [Pirellulaceae bacterium]
MAENQDRDQRTEDATPQRIRKAAEDGQLGFSAEFIAGIILSTAAAIALAFGRSFFESIADAMTHRFTYFEPMIDDPRMLISAIIADTTLFGIACLAFVGPVAVVAGMSGFLQTNFNISYKPLELDWNKLSVKSGVGRIFSSKSAVRGGLSIIKAAIIVGIIYLIARSRQDQIALAGFGSFRDLMFSLCEILLFASVAISAMMLVVGMIDLAYQKWKHLQDIRMSLQDIKDEHKESEGDPLIRARVKRLQSEMGRKRMLADVPKATAVVTNPTHFAVAIQYDRESMEAPIVLAKGADHLAKKIIAIAKENGVPVVERKPVARFLFANVNVGNAIPFEIYQAVAEILNFVNRMRSAL